MQPATPTADRSATARRSATGGAPPAATTSVGILGASGTTGVELARLLGRHPAVRVAFCTSRSEAGTRLGAIDPAAPDLPLVHPDEVDPSSVDVAFLCVPHGTAGDLAERFLDAGVRVIDVSGDHRLRDPETHRAIYGSPRSEERVREVVYGLTEFARDRVAEASFVACPGCYATASILALAPLSAAGLLTDLAVVDAKSGVSGAGRTPTATTHFCSASGDVQPYKVGRVHRHVAEVEQELRAHDPEGAEHRIVFNPHLVPLERGIEATVVVRGTDADAVRAALESAYRDEPFVRVLPDGGCARIRAVAGTNRAVLGVADAPGTDAVVVTCAIDNLLKGAAGQAVQNMNVMLGLAEATGLEA